MEQAAANFAVRARWDDQQGLSPEQWCSGAYAPQGGFVVCDARGRPLYVKPLRMEEPAYVTVEVGENGVLTLAP